jgi:hypothetical protein
MSLDDPDRNLERQAQSQKRNRPRPSGYLVVVMLAVLAIAAVIIWGLYEPQQPAPVKQMSPPVNVPAK